MRKITKTFFLLLAFSGIANAQRTPKQIRKEQDFVVKLNNDTIFGSINETWGANYSTWGGFTFAITTPDGNKTRYGRNEIKTVYFSRSLFKLIPKDPEKIDGKKDFFQIYMQSATHTLYCYSRIEASNNNVVYFIYEGDNFVEEIKRNNHREELLKYFGSCNEIVKAFNEKKSWFGDNSMVELANRYSNYKCY
jgi:hypothetical protein